MVFPYGVNKGIFNPNIVRFTIGDVYTNQPAYITSMNTNFEDVTTTWEISKGKQVPISATISMTFALIEKNSKTSASPFYNFTETLQDQTGNNIFNKQPTQQSTEQSTPPKNTETEAIKAPEQTRTGGSQVTAGGLVANIENDFASNPILPKNILNNQLNQVLPKNILNNQLNQVLPKNILNDRLNQLLPKNIVRNRINQSLGRR
jgi:hypothetical protein